MKNFYSAYTIKELTQLYKNKTLQIDKLSQKDLRYIIFKLSDDFDDKKNGDIKFEFFNKCVEELYKTKQTEITGEDKDIIPQRKQFVIENKSINIKIKNPVRYAFIITSLVVFLLLSVVSINNSEIIIFNIKNILNISQNEETNNPDYQISIKNNDVKSFDELYGLCGLSEDDIYIPDELIESITVFDFGYFYQIFMKICYKDHLYDIIIDLDDNSNEYFYIDGYDYLQTNSNIECYIDYKEKYLYIKKNCLIQIKYEDLDNLTNLINELYR